MVYLKTKNNKIIKFGIRQIRPGQVCIVKDFRTSHPKCYHFAIWIILSYRQMRPCGLKRKFCPSLNYLEELKWGAFLRMIIITRDKFHLSEPSIWQGKHLVTPYLLFLLLSCELTSCPWKPQAPSHSLTQVGI